LEFIPPSRDAEPSAFEICLLRFEVFAKKTKVSYKLKMNLVPLELLFFTIIVP